tara:strand:+ start:7340 stop:10639 length:3300 start_codon:yes stop_codon:yes gene_type:complete
MNSFVDLSIIECNRANSEEAKTNNNENPALWHNKLGTGITINPGDTISVEQAFVNEVAAGDQIIEFLGDFLGTKTINYTSASYINASKNIPQGYEKIIYTNVDEKVDIYDNKASIVINYYKTMNGENYIQLPRQFTCQDSIYNSTNNLTFRLIWNAQEGSVNLGRGGIGGNTGGLPFHQVPYFKQDDDGYFYYCQDDYYLSTNDFQDPDQPNNISTETTWKLRNDGSKYTIFVRDENYFMPRSGYAISASQATSPAETLVLSNPVGTFKFGQIVSIDGVFLSNNIITDYNASTKTLTFKNLFTYYGGEVISYDNASSIIAPQDYWKEEPSDYYYVEYKEKIDLEVPVGRASPSNIAESITNQLRKTDEFKQINFNTNTLDPLFKPDKPISGYINSNTYKVFDAMSAGDMTDINYGEFNNQGGVNHPDSASGLPDQPVLDWINAHQFIGVKRPDLYTYGWPLNASLTKLGTYIKIRYDISLTDNPVDGIGKGPDFIPTNIYWTEENLKLLKGLFDIQANYPELFKADFNGYGNGEPSEGDFGLRGIINPDNVRLLHINPYLENTSGTTITLLGTDDISGSGAPFNSRTSNYISFPLFVYFDKNGSNTLTDGKDVNNLAYGFAYKEDEYISFYTGGNPGGFQPPVEYFERNASAGAINKPPGAGNTIQAGTALGWDRHWTAYGNCVIGFIDGHMNFPYESSASFSLTRQVVEWENLWAKQVNAVINDTDGKQLSPQDFVAQIKKIYMGANEPLLNFDDVSGRFSLSQLHTPEYIGNDIRAGGAPSDSTDPEIPINPDADKKVYKINKRITNTNWTTAMLPYNSNYVVSASTTGANETKYDLPLMNPNFTAYSIMDAKSGITIKDFGVSDEFWLNSLWGILGFTYNQFNSPITGSNTYNVRITENNKNNLNFATTNADITSGQSIQYNVNGWGVPIFNQQLPVMDMWFGRLYNSSNTNQSQGTRNDFAIENYPPITEEQVSIQLTAINQPKKMIKPYFCIRSDIIDGAHYIGGRDSGQLLPVVSVINKINGYGDFYFANENQLVFTATQRKTITDITTSIHYPDQSFAEVNTDSAVIYKISRNQIAQSDILSELQGKIKSKI